MCTASGSSLVLLQELLMEVPELGHELCHLLLTRQDGGAQVEGALSLTEAAAWDRADACRHNYNATAYSVTGFASL